MLEEEVNGELDCVEEKGGHAEVNRYKSRSMWEETKEIKRTHGEGRISKM